MINLEIDDNSLAKTYDTISDQQFENGCALIEKLGVGQGNAVLDIGCGTGRLGFYVADRIGRSGRLVGIDPLYTRINIANERNRNPNAVFKKGVSDDLSFLADDSIDIVYLNAVFHWIVDKDATLGEVYRVLKPGGRLGLTTAAKELPNSFRLITDSVLKREPYNKAVRLEDDPMTKHGVTTTELVQLLSRFGFRVKDVQIKEIRRDYPTPKHVIDFLESSSFGNHLNHVPLQLREKARKEIENEFEKYRTGKGINFTGHTIFATAQKSPEPQHAA
jgi:ubiquinone/menaquinone biosynthesis C-methylase UbiE